MRKCYSMDEDKVYPYHYPMHVGNNKYVCRVCLHDGYLTDKEVEEGLKYRKEKISKMEFR